MVICHFTALLIGNDFVALLTCAIFTMNESPATSSERITVCQFQDGVNSRAGPWNRRLSCKIPIDVYLSISGTDLACLGWLLWKLHDPRLVKHHSEWMYQFTGNYKSQLFLIVVRFNNLQVICLQDARHTDRQSKGCFSGMEISCRRVISV